MPCPRIMNHIEGPLPDPGSGSPAWPDAAADASLVVGVLGPRAAGKPGPRGPQHHLLCGRRRPPRPPLCPAQAPASRRPLPSREANHIKAILRHLPPTILHPLSSWEVLLTTFDQQIFLFIEPDSPVVTTGSDPRCIARLLAVKVQRLDRGPAPPHHLCNVHLHLCSPRRRAAGAIFLSVVPAFPKSNANKRAVTGGRDNN